MNPEAKKKSEKYGRTVVFRPTVSQREKLDNIVEQNNINLVMARERPMRESEIMREVFEEGLKVVIANRNSKLERNGGGNA